MAVAASTTHPNRDALPTMPSDCAAESASVACSGASSTMGSVVQAARVKKEAARVLVLNMGSSG